jgi:serine/threonine protein kinase
MLLRPLFQGDSEIDQLYRIFRQFGTPDETTWKNVNQLPDFKDSFPKWEKSTLPTRIYPDINAIELFSKMLRYDPEDRVSARDALEHPFFNDVALVKVQLPLPPGQAASNTHEFME